LCVRAPGFERPFAAAFFGAFADVALFLATFLAFGPAKPSLRGFCAFFDFSLERLDTSFRPGLGMAIGAPQISSTPPERRSVQQAKNRPSNPVNPE
jgi:hypothetical protein